MFQHHKRLCSKCNISLVSWIEVQFAGNNNLLVESCFCHGSPGYNFPRKIWMICYHATQIAEMLGCAWSMLKCCDIPFTLTGAGVLQFVFIKFWAHASQNHWMPFFQKRILRKMRYATVSCALWWLVGRSKYRKFLGAALKLEDPARSIVSFT